jgi:hypothetical protein
MCIINVGDRESIWVDFPGLTMGDTLYNIVINVPHSILNEGWRNNIYMSDIKIHNSMVVRLGNPAPACCALALII